MSTCTCYDTLVVKDLNRWFKEKWVDVSRKDKDGKHPPCGRSKAKKGSKGYPKCRPSVKVSSKTPKTSGSMSEGQKRAATKRKRSKKQGVGGKPTIVKQVVVLKMPFHGTTEDAIEGGRFFGGIKRRGLQPKPPQKGRQPEVYFTDSPYDAAGYAKARAKQNNSRPVLIEFPESDVPAGAFQFPAYAGNYRTTRQTIPSTNFQYHYGPQREEGVTDEDYDLQMFRWMNSQSEMQNSPEGNTQQQPQQIQTGEPMDIAFRLLKNPISPEAKRHKLEYDKKYESTPERVKYRSELRRERRHRGIDGKGGPDMSHTKDHTLVAEDPHSNRARHFKERGTLKSDVVLVR